MSPPIYAPDGTEVSEIVLPDGSTASEVIGPGGNVVFEAGPDIPDIGDYQWYVDEGAGTTITAGVGSVDATTNGGPTWVSDSTALGGQHLSHDGADDYWQTDSGVLTTPFSVGGWVRFDDMTEFGNGIAASPSGSWYVDSDGDGGLLTVDGSSSELRDVPFVSGSEWGFFALNAESDGHRLITFSNTQELADESSTTVISASDESLLVGTHKDGGSLLGDSDFYVVKTGSIFTKQEITDLWEATQR